MLSRQVVVELLIVEEVLLAEVAPGVRQDLGLLFVARVSVINVSTQEVRVVEPLLFDKDQATFEAYLAVGLLVVAGEVGS